MENLKTKYEYLDLSKNFEKHKKDFPSLDIKVARINYSLINYFNLVSFLYLLIDFTFEFTRNANGSWMKLKLFMRI